MYMVKITENTVTPEQLVGSTLVAKAPESFGGDLTVEITEDMIQINEGSETAGMIMVGLDGTLLIMTTYGDMVSAGAPFSSGTYFLYMPVDDGIVYTHSLSCLNGIQELTVPIADKFISDNIARTDEVPSVIIDVVELPTENIDTHAIYRLTNNGKFRQKYASTSIYHIERSYHVHCVEELPETPEPFDTDNVRNYYYNVNDSKNSVWVFTSGWSTNPTPVYLETSNWSDSTYGTLITVESKLYTYKNGWIEVSSALASGSGEGTAMIIKSPNGTRFQITVSDDGNLTATAIT